MPKYVIEREIPGVGASTADALQAISQTSCNVLIDMGPQIQWIESYVSDDKIYCVYIAANEEMVREHASRGGFPANRISRNKIQSSIRQPPRRDADIAGRSRQIDTRFTGPRLHFCSGPFFLPSFRSCSFSERCSFITSGRASFTFSSRRRFWCCTLFRLLVFSVNARTS